MTVSENRFKDSDVDVTRKDGILLLRELAGEVKNFMDFKMNAVMVWGRSMKCTVSYFCNAAATDGRCFLQNHTGEVRKEPKHAKGLNI
uniref:Uncharacterized protein n=1 Tax=Anopheles epiroticus TaxID=199890 RepID=A0A182P3C6_9DIPT